VGPAPPRWATPLRGHRFDGTPAQQMHDAVLSHAGSQHLFIAVAAVADWRVANASAQKLKKNDAGAVPQLHFAQNPDILAAVAALPDKPYCVGFAAESENLLTYAEEKRIRKGIPLLIGNIGHQTFGKDENELVLFDDRGNKRLPRAAKQDLARQLIAEIAARL